MLVRKQLRGNDVLPGCVGIYVAVQVPSPLSTHSTSALLGPSTASDNFPGPADLVSIIKALGLPTTPFLIPKTKRDEEVKTIKRSNRRLR